VFRKARPRQARLGYHDFMSDKQAVARANESFYRAFQDMDMEQMSQVWDQSESSICIHPGWEMLSGWREIRESWRAIFAHTGYMRFEASDVDIQIIDGAARVSCIENIFTVADGMTIHSRVACTNLFVRKEKGWLLVLHHGSAIAESQSVQIPDGEMAH
jgi:hypothetical protein